MLRAARRCGVLDTVRNSKWRSQRLLILCYHGISIDDEHEWDSCLFMPQQLFRERLQMLRRGSYAVLPFNEAISRLYAGDLPPRAVALTFDDGFHDFRDRAVPVLAEFGYPAIVYVATYYATHRYPVFNVFFSYLLWKGRKRMLDLEGIIPGPSHVRLTTAAERAEALERILNHVRKEKLTDDQQSHLGRLLASHIGIDYDRLCDMGLLHIMNEEEISELSRFNVAVQLHTHHHRTPDDEYQFRAEIRDNRDHIAGMGLQAEALQHFCYPCGRFKPKFFSWLQAENVLTATTCQHALASSDTPPLALPRVLDSCDNTPIEFEGWLTGAYQFLPRRF
jgi:peptidoglycan/xylan/chitin deacetylase (PgdA/CDA1 family)